MAKMYKAKGSETADVADNHVQAFLNAGWKLADGEEAPEPAPELSEEDAAILAELSEDELQELDALTEEDIAELSALSDEEREELAALGEE